MKVVRLVGNWIVLCSEDEQTYIRVLNKADLKLGEEIIISGKLASLIH